LIYLVFYSILFIFGTTLLSNAITLGTSLGFASLSETNIFGEQRLWGTVGFGLSAFLASRLYEYFETRYVYVILFTVASIACMLVTDFIRIQPNKRKSTAITAKDSSSVKQSPQADLSALIPLLKKADVIVFLTLTFIWGISYAVLDPVSQHRFLA
jgi:MFS family permease